MPTSCCAEAPSSRPRIRLRILQLDVLSASRTFPVLKLGSSGNAVYRDLPPREEELRPATVGRT